MFTAERALRAMSQVRVLIVGDLMLDRYVWGRATRLSPEAPVPVVEVMRESCVAGGAANVAVNAAAMGASVRLVGAIGQDLAGEALRQAIHRFEVGTDLLVSVPDRPTTEKTRVMAANQQLLRIDQEELSAVAGEVEEQVLRQVESALPHTDVVILSDYRKGLLVGTLPPRIIELAQRAGLPVVTDSKARHYAPFQGSVITPNRLEAERATGYEIQDAVSLVQAGGVLREQTGGALPVLITLGDEGIAFFEGERADGAPTVIPAISTSVYDVTGAGDTVVSTLALALAAGCSVRESAVLANYAAAVVVREAGTAVCTPEKLRAMIEESGEVWELYVSALQEGRS
ncbi:MAG TPA: PfkB family carbohydrate kinase [Bacilli bacterium]|nr:PfkB family carbohydrate kinase [Bacilli bacterium]